MNALSDDPAAPAYVTGAELDPAIVREITESLGPAGIEVCRQLVAAAIALDEGDRPAALRHADAARRRGSRLAAVREAAGVVAYRSGEYAAALKDLQAARRIGGSGALAVIADCERALGRPERALELARSPGADTLDTADRVELLIVTAGARMDLGQPDAAVATLRTPYLEAGSTQPWQGRLWTAYAEMLSAAGRESEATLWRRRAARHPSVPPAEAGEPDGDVLGPIVDLTELPVIPTRDVPGPPAGARPSTGSAETGGRVTSGRTGGGRRSRPAASAERTSP